jgi:hypothetical protein
MPSQTTFHSLGGYDFLGYRKAPSGAVEIVYDDGARRRMIWRVATRVSERMIGDALAVAVNQARVLPALYAELKKRSIAIEAIAR